MKQFYLASSIAAASTKLSALTNGAVGFTAKDKDEITTNVGELINGFNLVVGSDYPYFQPIHINKFSYVKSTYRAAVNKKVTFTIPAVTDATVGSYTIILVANGAKFNERNKWVVDEYVPAALSATDLATKLCNKLKALTTLPFNINVTLSTATITIEGTNGKDFTVVLSDKLSNVTVTTSTQFKPAVNSAEQIEDLYNKCIADKGVNYTYSDTNGELYPNHPKNQSSKFTAAGYTLFTLRFAEPRITKTTDEVINQIVHVAFPSNVTVDSFESILDALANNATIETSASLD